MRLLLLGWLLGWILVPPSHAQDTLQSRRRVAYRIDATLHPETRTVTGTELVTWRNPADHPVGELQFHLYLNAFRNERSTFMRESGGRHRGFAADSTAWGGITIDRLRLTSTLPAVTLTDRLRFIQPDDDNEDDRTVAALTLPRPVPPGGTATLRIEFTAKLPKIFARTGWVEKYDGSLFFMVAQWFPKLGVYEVPGQRYVPEDAERGAWNTHQFHANSEFYADFGTYDVTMTVPQDYVVGATGRRVRERSTDSTRTLTYHAQNVHDFAWTASPEFEVYTDQWRGVKLRLLLQPEHDGQVQRHFEAAKTGMRYFSEWVGEYPYGTLTLVDGLGGSNGMEYPTLITCGTTYMLPSWLRFLEMVTIHEFGHQYFYGLIASNEAEEAWLDEGINSYLEGRIMDTAYGPGSMIDLPGLRVSGFEVHHAGYAENNPSQGVTYQRSWRYHGGYAKASYSKPATVLRTLERYLGWPTMQELLHTYYRRWRFRHPTTRDFIQVAEDVSGEDLGWFFDQFIYGTEVVDYAVDSIVVERPDSLRGGYVSEVRVRRQDDGIFPMPLRVRFEDGRTQTLAWDGKAQWKTFAFTSSAPVVEAFLDPKHVAWLETDRLDNRKVRPPRSVLARKQQFKFTVWLQQFFQLMTGFL